MLSEKSSGNFDVIIEASDDLVAWTPFFSQRVNSATAKRLIRTRITSIGCMRVICRSSMQRIMQAPSGPRAWEDFYRTGVIHETEFFHGLVACAKSNSLEVILSVLSGEEKSRFVGMLRSLIELDEILAGQMVTSVARYSIADAHRVLEEIEVSV